MILGGSDRRGTALPESGRDKQPLMGFKGAKLTVGGRPLISVVIERMANSGLFDPIFIAGPASVYRPLLPDARIIDTDASFGENLRSAVDAVSRELDPDLLAFTTSDILPTEADLRRIVDDIRSHLPLDFWMLQCRVDRDLGASAWKPRYRLQPADEDHPVPVLPGHLVIGNPGVVRVEMVYRLFEMLYRTRNRSLRYRVFHLTRRLLWGFFLDDLRSLASLRLPRMLWEVVINSLVAAVRLARGIRIPEIEDRMRRVYIRPEHRRRYPDRRGRVAVLDALSFAKDIDTVEEAREVERHGFEG
ncbi:MAG: hypothetical protein AAGD06_25010 [Acidobacteriota bacterium]